jgi:hypothetical protein
MEVLRSTRFKIGAPAVVVLATVVNAAACDQNVDLVRQSAPDLSWAVTGGAQGSDTRTIIAQRAAKDIRTLDRVSGAPALNFTVAPVPTDVAPNSHNLFLPLSTLQAESTHQHSAP